MIAQRQPQPQPQLMTPEEYLEWEEQQPIKYEYINGEVFAMIGGTIPHNDIAINLTSALKNHLRGKGCKVQMADAKVGVSRKGPFHYPDVMVSCNPEDQKARKFIYHPCLIVEVLSPGTEGFDRGKKFKNYRQIDTLKEYVLIETDKMNVECYRINEKGKWELTAYSLEQPTDNGTEIEIHLTSVDFRFPISLLYEDVVFPEDNPEDTTDN
ncbi:Uma2 family endonuclease [Limnofasciculus baicalensis]|uniref:Uma2 family endonuclease n=1 Tax=Limnofasciculus baicalensis BBK-W-15 TaxID=2699891 RepID=A0AAE3GW14_9CYAN|nr:Uma2 family endonuclease [Limnofasciculus baicalensis]MCP2729607.1 Uma2 family endonuclease [Limnofasciculus baicalensis BBK-W-15]